MWLNDCWFAIGLAGLRLGNGYKSLILCVTVCSTSRTVLKKAAGNKEVQKNPSKNPNKKYILNCYTDVTVYSGFISI